MRLHTYLLFLHKTAGNSGVMFSAYMHMYSGQDPNSFSSWKFTKFISIYSSFKLVTSLDVNNSNELILVIIGYKRM